MKKISPLPTQTRAPEKDGAPEDLLARVADKTAQPPNGIAIGVLSGFDAEGGAQVDIPLLALRAVAARSIVTIEPKDLGREVALGFEAGDAGRPVILGLMLLPALQTPGEKVAPAHLEARLDGGETLLLEAEHELELRCGEASILLTADGRIHIRGQYITSQAEATQRILGGNLSLN
jgi:hypothetical protein